MATKLQNVLEMIERDYRDRIVPEELEPMDAARRVAFILGAAGRPGYSHLRAVAKRIAKILGRA